MYYGSTVSTEPLDLDVNVEIDYSYSFAVVFLGYSSRKRSSKSTKASQCRISVTLIIELRQKGIP